MLPTSFYEEILVLIRPFANVFLNVFAIFKCIKDPVVLESFQFESV